MKRYAAALLAACMLFQVPVAAPRAEPAAVEPSNPNTNGAPFGFEALAGDGLVRLKWQHVDSSTLVGYQIFRRSPLETTFHAITPVLNVGATSFLDFGLLNGQDYAYRLYFV